MSNGGGPSRLQTLNTRYEPNPFSVEHNLEGMVGEWVGGWFTCPLANIISMSMNRPVD